jgi:putative heme-binding domain-containing protein
MATLLLSARRLVCLVALTSAVGLLATRQDDPDPPESSLVKLLKSGRVPEARQGAVVEMIGKRGSAVDLAFIYRQALAQAGFSPTVRVKALDALAEAAANRNVRPSSDLEKLVPLLKPSSSPTDAAIRRSAVRLAGAWKLADAVKALGELAASPNAGQLLRSEAFDALTAIGGDLGRSRIEALCTANQPAGTRLAAVAALAKLDLNRSAPLAAEILAQPADPARDLLPLLAAFLNRQGGGEALAAALGRRSVPPDSAKLALRGVYALGRADPALVAALSRAAGIAAESPPLTPGELAALVAEVAKSGDPARGEQVFRRPDLSCMSCHALSKAGGDVGPDLSAIGQTSPPDYIINSIMTPDQAIKEQYHTLLVLTLEGQVFQGIVADKDEQRIVLKEATGQPRVIPVASIDDQKPGGSLMPKGLVNLMTRAEFIDLVRFLAELGKPGPYAVRSTPAIQRWKLLKSISADLSQSVPEGDALRDKVLKAEADHWTVCYAKVSGLLPLEETLGASGSPVVYLEGEIDVSSAGPVQIQLDSADGTELWIDEHRRPERTPKWSTPLAVGRHTIVVRIDTTARPSKELRAELVKPAGSTAEFTVVGGR